MSSQLKGPRKRSLGDALLGRGSVNYRISEDHTDEGQSKKRRRVAYEKPHKSPKFTDNMDNDTILPDQEKDISLLKQDGSVSDHADERKSESHRSSMKTTRFNPESQDRVLKLHSGLETAARNIQLGNQELRRNSDDHRHRASSYSRDETGSYSKDAMRRLRNKYAKLMNENDSLLARIRGLERDIRDGVGDRARKLMEEISAWRRRYDHLSYTADGLQSKLAVATDRNKRLGEVCERRARNERRYKAILRHRGLL